MRRSGASRPESAEHRICDLDVNETPARTEGVALRGVG